jgi:hypothetical protein
MFVRVTVVQLGTHLMLTDLCSTPCAPVLPCVCGDGDDHGGHDHGYAFDQHDGDDVDPGWKRFHRRPGSF